MAGTNTPELESTRPKQVYERLPLPWENSASVRPQRILLVSPHYNTHIIAPHLGLGYLAAALRRSGHHVTVQDGLRERVQYPRDVDLVGVTAMTTYFPEAVAEVARAKSMGLKTIIGGPHVIADPEGSVRQSGADFACAGEGELALTSLANGLSPEQIPGLLWMDGATVKRSAAPNFYPQIDDFGEPAWDLIDPRTYPPAPHGMIAKSFPLAPIITTRGCPYRCSYCSAPATAGRRLRTRNPERVVDEIERLIKDHGVREIQIEDDNFTLNRKHTVAICEELLRRNVKVHWSLPNGVRIDKLDLELLKLMKRAGCYLMALGIESANQRILNMVSKDLDCQVVRQVVEWVVKSGIEAWGFFMIGFPTETLAEVNNTIEFALSLPLTRAQFTKTTPLPGTSIYEWWKREWGNGVDINWATFNYYAFNSDWSEVPAAELNRLQKRAHLRFYRRPKNFLTIVKSLRMRQYTHAVRRLLNLGSFRPDNMRRAECAA
jgi:radical SAM superfamily enzyme YgiQ (UPF0313 family)